MIQDFEILPHTADFRLKVYGATKEDLFRNALSGMFQAIKPKAADCRYIDNRLVCPDLPARHLVKIRSDNINSLLVDFLSETLYLSDVKDEAYLDAAILKLTDTELEARIKGVKIQGFEAVEIKAVTYHELDIKRVGDYFETVIVFDI